MFFIHNYTCFINYHYYNYLSERMISAALICTITECLGCIHTSGFSCNDNNNSTSTILIIAMVITHVHVHVHAPVHVHVPCTKVIIIDVTKLILTLILTKNKQYLCVQYNYYIRVRIVVTTMVV